jgi:restriction system protein
MPSRYPFQETVRNPYLGVSKIIKAMTPWELDWLVEKQIAKWDAQESKKRQQKANDEQRILAKQEVEGLKIQADAYTKEAKDRLEIHKTILRNISLQSFTIDWDLLIDRDPYPPFVFSHPKPDKNRIRLELLGPAPTEKFISEPLMEEPSFFELIFSFLGKKRRERNELSMQEYDQAKHEARVQFAKNAKKYKSNEHKVVEAYNLEAYKYNALLQVEKQNYIEGRRQFISNQKAHSESILDLKARYEKGLPDGVERLVSMGLDKSSYPDDISFEAELQFDSPSKTLIFNCSLPKLADIPNIVEYRYVAARKAIKPIEMKAKEFEAFYDDVLHQIALRAVCQVFVLDYSEQIQAVVFNGWISGIDPKTGKEFTSCILSFDASRQKFMDLNLAHVSPKECVRGFKGITAGPLAMLAPVKPIMDIKRDDDRFVESRAVADQMLPGENLAGMDWEDFEHLIRELFEQEFSKNGGEVRITQASRDRGVDAIAFDEDPIRGGKFVIQAKRYKMVVPVSAVRDLYGTMISEGAVKGILVTTSYFGRDSREFAKDKPISLIDGEGLVYMFQKFGRDVHISLLPKGDPRRGI